MRRLHIDLSDEVYSALANIAAKNELTAEEVATGIVENGLSLFDVAAISERNERKLQEWKKERGFQSVSKREHVSCAIR